jgi:hypothetical protein
MNSPLQRQRLDGVLQIITQARPLVDSINRRDRDLASQIRRALNSEALNLAEGSGSTAGNERLRFSTALGSLYEAWAGFGLPPPGATCPPMIAPASSLPAIASARVFGLNRH